MRISALALAVEGAEARALSSPTVAPGPTPQCAHSSAPPCRRTEGASYAATIRRYEGVDGTRTSEVARKVNETLVPQLRELPSFSGYYLIAARDGVLSSLGLFETREQADESTKLVSKWITDENFATVLPNAPKITSGKVVAHSDRMVAVA